MLNATFDNSPAAKVYLVCFQWGEGQSKHPHSWANIQPSAINKCIFRSVQTCRLRTLPNLLWMPRLSLSLPAFLDFLGGYLHLCPQRIEEPVLLHPSFPGVRREAPQIPKWERIKVKLKVELSHYMIGWTVSLQRSLDMKIIWTYCWGLKIWFAFIESFCIFNRNGFNYMCAWGVGREDHPDKTLSSFKMSYLAHLRFGSNQGHFKVREMLGAKAPTLASTPSMKGWQIRTKSRGQGATL